MSDAWDSPGEAPFGAPEPGSGRSVNEVFSVDRVFKVGLSMLQEQPVFVLVGGLACFVAQLLPQLASSASDLLTAGVGATGSLDPDLVQGIGGLASLLLMLAFFPIQQFLLAGLMAGSSHWISRDEVSLPVIFTSFAAGLRVILVALLGAFLSLVVAVVVLAPAIVGAAVLVVAEQPIAGAVVGGLLLIPATIALVWVSLGLVLGPYAAAIDGLGPVAALAAGWGAASGARLTLFANLLVFGLLGVASLCLCGVPGILLTGIQVGGFTGAWLLHRRSAEETGQWGFVQRHDLL